MKNTISKKRLIFNVIIKILFLICVFLIGYYYSIYSIFKQDKFINLNSMNLLCDLREKYQTASESDFQNVEAEIKSDNIAKTYYRGIFKFPDSAAKLILPDNWYVEESEVSDNHSYKNYKLHNEILLKEYDNVIISEINIQDWLRNSIKDERFTMTSKDKEKIIEILKQIYEQENVSQDLANEIKNTSDEFFGYSKKKTDFHYLESNDNKSRGFTFVNYYNPGIAEVYPSYQIILYNPKYETIITFYFNSSNDYLEVKEINKQIVTILNQESDNVDEKIQKAKTKAEENLLNLLEQPRENYSFGKFYKQIDEIAKTLVFD